MKTATQLWKQPKSFLTAIPARMDRLPWSRFHWAVVFALGITWVLDGLEVTLKGAISGVLQDPQTLGLSSTAIGLIASCYVTGTVVGALIFGYLTDRWGRKKLFFITLCVYLAGVILSAFSWDLVSFCAFRFLTGAGIGGEYSAINSAIDELIPARVRGRVDLMINGSYWLGAAVGSLSTIVLLNPKYFPVDTGWRVGFLVGGLLGFSILLLRRYIPESPRWLMVHNKKNEAEEIVSQIEERIEEETGKKLSEPQKTLRIYPRLRLSFGSIIKVLFQKYRRQSFVSFVMIASQAFLYNAMFFTYPMVLTSFYHVPGKDTGLYLLPFALGNLMGPFALGHLFDIIGRRRMIFMTYLLSGLFLILSAHLFAQDQLSVFGQTLLWSTIFFFGSAAASSAYLTVSEIFPLESRGLTIAIFYALGTAVGGVVAPWLFGRLIDTGSRLPVYHGYMVAAVLLILTSIIALIWGINAEKRSLEDVAMPLTALPS